MWISRTVCLFMIYSCMGWIYETTLCTVKDGKWENRGFFYGPVCPIYGTGAVGISMVMALAGDSHIILKNWQIFVVSVIGSAVLEYVTSWTLEKLFHAVWWDYSNLPFNLHGRISLFSSLGFGVGGLLVVYVIAPYTENAVRHVTPILMELLSLCFLAVFMVDLTLTVTALMHFDQMVVHAEDIFNRKMEGLVESTVQRTEHFVDSTKQRTEQLVDSTKQKTGQLVDSTKQKTGQLVDSTKQKTGQFVDSTKQKTGQLVDSTKQVTGQLVDSTKQRTEQLVESTVQKTEQIRQGFAAGQRYVSNLNTGSIGRLAKSAMKRVRGIRYDNEDKEMTVNHVLSQIRGENSSQIREDEQSDGTDHNQD